MTLQWSAVALVLYAEIAVTILLLVPWIRASLWNRLFKSRFLHMLERHANVYSWAGIAVLLLLFFDAIREVRKYAYVDTNLDAARTLHTADADTVTHMRLFRAQRNLYISGFALFLFLIIKRLVALIARCSQLEAAAEAAMKQAQGASKAAKSLMESNEKDGKEGGGSADVKELKRQIDELGKELKSTQKDRDAMKMQSENLHAEYGRLSEEYNSKMQGGAQQGGNKKKN